VTRARPDAAVTTRTPKHEPEPEPRGSEGKRVLLHQEIIQCQACPRLVKWREQVAHEKRPRFADWDYWARPVPGFGDPAARLVIVGLAPAAHGANRTGRVFTGDRSGDFLFEALHRRGLCNQPRSFSKDDGLVLRDTFILTPLRCAPPDNRPLPVELTRCMPFFDRELALLPRAKVVVALGAIAFDAYLAHAKRLGRNVASGPRPRFAHGAEHLVGKHVLLASYHVSQQNTQTGRLSPSMFDGVLVRAQTLVREHA
jgi:uracil-DNA glycosylase family 4